MYMHWMNTMVGYCGPFKYESEYCEKLRSYLEANLAWMEERMGKGEDPEYWHQVRVGYPHPGSTPPPLPKHLPGLIGALIKRREQDKEGFPGILAGLQVG